MDEYKRAAAIAALDHVENGMRLGIGTGSTAEHFIEVLAERVDGGLSVIGVPTSERTAQRCTELGIELASLDEVPELDLTVDGADEIDPNLNLIKGAGGALLREKIVASASARMIVIADETKLVEQLGAFALPIEVTPFGMQATQSMIARTLRAQNLPDGLTLREGREGAYRTDGGNHIYDATLGHIADVPAVARALAAIPGVVEHGLFVGIADTAVVAGPNGVRSIHSN